MHEYYTTVENIDGKYIAIMRNTNTNVEAYRTKPYPNQVKALHDINMYLVSIKNTNTDNNVQTPIKNTTVYQTIEIPNRSCCGR